MLTFEEFTNYVLTETKIEGACIRKVEKYGESLTGLTAKSDTPIAPTIYLDFYYKRYEEGEGLDKLLSEIEATYKKGLADIPEGAKEVVENFNNFEWVKKKLIFTLVNASSTSYLKDKVYRVVEGLAIIYKVIVDNDEENGMATITVMTQHADAWGVTEADLYEVAKENTPMLLPAKVQSMAEVVAKQMGISVEECEMMMGDSPMWVISNNQSTQGAAVIFYEDVLKNLSEKLDSDLFIIPSSIHEAIALPQKNLNPEDLKRMIVDVNGSMVAPQERLSDNPYAYSIKDGFKLLDVEAAPEKLTPERKLTPAEKEECLDVLSSLGF